MKLFSWLYSAGFVSLRRKLSEDKDRRRRGLLRDNRPKINGWVIKSNNHSDALQVASVLSSTIFTNINFCIVFDAVKNKFYLFDHCVDM